MLIPALGCSLLGLASQDAAVQPALVVREWLAIDEVDEIRGRRPFRADAVFARHLLAPGSPAPVAGEALTGELGRERRFEPLSADEGGGFERSCSWAFATLELDEPQAGVWLADLRGAQVLFVNGDGFVGDYYDAYGWRGVPVELRAGKNELYVGFVRGKPRLAFERPPAPLFLAAWDATRPALLADAPNEVALAVPIVNASNAPLEGVNVELRVPSTGEWLTPVAPFPLPPLGMAKPAIVFDVKRHEGELELLLDPRAAGLERDPAGRRGLKLASKAGGERRTLTYRSAVDDSVQAFAVVPASDASLRPGLVLSLHGAGVEAARQAGSYPSYPDLWIVAPTNRREFGFDWQDWGRRDAYDVLARALALSGADPDRVHLTGHSMGGHGAWHLAANDPDRWASIAPSAGWESFDSYGGRPDGALADVWQDADGASRTLALVSNLAQLPTYVLHGEADDNVPASEAGAMLAALEAAGARPASHFQPEAGHWWDGDDAPGTACLAWPGIFELFRASRRARDPHALEFVTVDPGVDAQHHWVRVDQLVSYGRPARVVGSFDAAGERVTLECTNVRRLAFLRPPGWTVRRLVVDGFNVELGTESAAVELAFADGAWKVAPPVPGEKTPERGGPFKRAFDRRFVLVYGTQGSAAETANLLARARFDAATWAYRANGTTLVLSDAQFLDAAHAKRWAGRNAIVYGNADTNSAWGSLVPESSPVKARRGAIEIGALTFRGDDLACVFVQPRRGDPDALVGVFADSGVRGARLGYTFQTFGSGAGFPDVALVDASVLAQGDAGVLAAGFFDARWQLPGLRHERAAAGR